MAKVFRTNISLAGNQILSGLLHPTATAPTGLGAGQVYYNTSTNILSVYNGSTWLSLVNSGVTSLPSLGTVLTTLTGFVSAAAGVLSAASTISGASVSGNIAGNAANVTGIIPLTNGGTGANLTNVPGGIVYGGATTLAITSVGVSGYVLTSAGASAPTWTQAATTNVNSAIVQRDSAGNIAVTQVTVNADPSAALQVATKQYVDNIASGVNAHDAVVAATTAALTVTYSNGTSGVNATLTNAGAQAAFTIDNVSPIVGDRILVKNQAAALQNGIYSLTTVGTGATNWVLTRTTDYDGNVVGEISAGDIVFVVAPAAEFSVTPTNQNTSWIMNSAGTISVGSSSITWVQSSGGTSITAGAGIGVSGNTVSIALGTAFDTSAGSDTTGLSLGSSTLKLRLDPAGGLTTTTAGAKVSLGTGLTMSGNNITLASGYGVRKFVGTITGDGATVNFPITHSLATNDVQVRVYQTSATPDTQYADIEVDVTRNTTNQVTIGFGVAPASSAITYNVVIVG